MGRIVLVIQLLLDIELDADYFNIAKERINLANGGNLTRIES